MVCVDTVVPFFFAAQQSDFELQFLTRGTTDAVVLPPSPTPPSLSKLTMCWWMRTTDSGTLTPVNVVDSGAQDVLAVELGGNEVDIYLLRERE